MGGDKSATSPVCSKCRAFIDGIVHWIGLERYHGWCLPRRPSGE